MLKKEDVDLSYVLKLGNGRGCYLAERAGINSNEIILYNKDNGGYNGVTRIDDFNANLQYNLDGESMIKNYSVTHYYKYRSQNEAIRAILYKEEIPWIKLNTEDDIDWSKVEVGTEFYVSDDAEFNCMFIYKFACTFNEKPYFKKIESDDGCLYSWNYYKPANKLTY